MPRAYMDHRSPIPLKFHLLIFGIAIWNKYRKNILLDMKSATCALYFVENRLMRRLFQIRRIDRFEWKFPSQIIELCI